MKSYWAPSHKTPSLGTAVQPEEETPEYLLWFRWWQVTKHQGSIQRVFSCGKGRQTWGFKGQEHTAGIGWVLTLLLAFSFLQELQRNPYLIVDGVSRFDIMQGEIGKVMLLFWKRLAQSNKLWLLCYVLRAWWDDVDRGSRSKQLVQINPDSHKPTHYLLQIFSRIPKCSGSNPCYLYMVSAF